MVKSGEVTVVTIGHEHDSPHISHGDHGHSHGGHGHSHGDGADHDLQSTLLPNEKPTNFRAVFKQSANMRKLCLFAILLFIFFFLEVVFAVISGSVSLLSDAFHMISDLASTILAVYAIVVSHKPQSENYTYGLSRAQVLGGLVNGIFLLSVSFMMAIEVVMKFSHPEELKEIADHGMDITIVGAVGLAVNIFGMWLLRGHGHGHSHGGGDTHGHGHGGEESNHGGLNMHAAWLHAMGDTLGSVVVVMVGLIVNYAEGDWRFYADPVLTLIILAIITYSAIPLVKSCIKILLQGTPNGMQLVQIEKDLSGCDESIIDVHDLHLWELEPGRCVGSMHVVFGLGFTSTNFPNVAAKMKAVMHRHGVHSIAIQPEFSEHDCDDEADSEECSKQMSCLMPCTPDCENENICCDDRSRERSHVHRRSRANAQVTNSTFEASNTAYI